MKNIALIVAICVFVIGAGVYLVRAGHPNGKSVESQSASSSLNAPVAATTTASTSVNAVHPIPTPAPAPTPVPQSKSGIRGSVTIGPTCPVQKDPPDPACADKPYQTTLVVSSTITGRNGGVLVQTDAQGHFTKELTPGIYTIRSTSNNVYPTLAPVTVTVTSGKWTQVSLQFDSGIR